MNECDLRVALCAEVACALEVTAPKFGNVHSQCEFPSLTFTDMMRSAKAIAPIMGRAVYCSTGDTILQAIQETRRVATTNTNLGIVLLLAPLAAVAKEAELRLHLPDVLDRLSIEDAKKTYQAIRLANPGGLGVVEKQDIFSEPTVTLREAMSLAADRDLIARQYVNGFTDVFEGADRLAASSAVSTIQDRVVELQIWYLARDLDTLVCRKRGENEARELQKLATELRNSLPHQRAKPQAALEQWFAAEFPQRNPGATADLVCASLFVALRTGIIPLPLSSPWPPDLT